MPNRYDVIFLGTFASIDPTEGNTVAEDADTLEGLTVGGFGDTLVDRIGRLRPTGPNRFGRDGNTYYDQDAGAGDEDTFQIDGGPTQEFDAAAVYDATITYLDGTTADISAVVFQDTDGNTYLAPELSANADQAALEAAPLLSITLNSLDANSFLGMTGDRDRANFVPCFVAGTLVETETGPVPVEHLKVGDRVRTQDNGHQVIRWIGVTERKVEGALVPVRLKAGSLGAQLPNADLLVSLQHRMLMRSRIAARMTGHSEVLVPAKALLPLPGVEEAHDMTSVTYVHFKCDRHEIVFANGAPTESLLTGPQALRALGPEAEAELRSLFPDLETLGVLPARPIPPGKLRRKMVARHLKNAKAVLRA